MDDSDLDFQSACVSDEFSGVKSKVVVDIRNRYCSNRMLAMVHNLLSGLTLCNYPNGSS